ncbi:D-lactate dehydrogenase cytochrome, mitochondrial [Porphyridium purpureum]|uniref:D-lactate dehydrogenase (cytochrome) n=1 Tax=Porphyridium purpureum TaxID=35688 RepID=A0A5J4YRX5_PORPP|nr:D-lactate dehydrogenase cytochrome, mitochondrial [Porphyridium purpureum]|eukprot:POR0591..scf236_6
MGVTAALLKRAHAYPWTALAAAQVMVQSPSSASAATKTAASVARFPLSVETPLRTTPGRSESNPYNRIWSASARSVATAAATLAAVWGAGMYETGWMIHADQGDGPSSNGEQKQGVGLQMCLQELCEHFKTRPHVITADQDERSSFSRDPSFHNPVLPDAVVRPESVDDVVAVVKACSKYKVPIIPFGAGTSLEGHVIPTESRRGITMSLAAMDAMLEFRPEDMTVTVQPGMSYNDLNEWLEPHRLFFPPDPGAGAQIGGMIGTNCGGTNAVMHGSMKDNVLSLEVVLANGDVIQTRKNTRKSSAGYQITNLFVGSEGTLGVVTSATLKLSPLPKTSSVVLMTFDSIGSAAACAAHLVSSGVPLSRCELLDDVMIRAVKVTEPLPDVPDGRTVLLVELVGTPDHVKTNVEMVSSCASDFKVKSLRMSQNDEEREELWRIRKVAYWNTYSLRSGCEVWTTDVCVPISRLAECIEQSRSDFAQAGLIAPVVAHAGDGNFHFFILFDPANSAEVELAASVNRKMVLRALDMGGTCTGEHGVGMGKMEFLEPEHGEPTLNLMRSIKRALDPDELFNPGKILPAAHLASEHVPQGAPPSPLPHTGASCSSSLTPTIDSPHTKTETTR